MTDDQKIEALVAMLGEAHGAIEVELEAVGPDDVKDHPVLSSKREMLKRHEQRLAQIIGKPI